MALNSSSNDSASHDKRWVIDIRSFFEEELDDDANDVPASIFSVPKTLKAVKPDAYTPQLIAFGPLHHFREDLFEIERYKLACAKRIQSQLENLQLQHLANKLRKIEFHVRACYHKYFDMDGETLAWMMAIDGLFLLEFLHACVDKNHSVLASSARMSQLIDSTGKKLAHHTIFEDILMLENQLPISVLKKVMHVKWSSSDMADDLLSLVLISVCKQLSPLKFDDNCMPSKVIEHAHLLDLLHQLIVSSPDQQQQGEEDLLIKEDREEANPSIDADMETLSETWKILSKLNLGVMNKLKGLMNSKPIKFVLKMPIKMISKIPIISAIAPALENFLPSVGKEAIKPENGSSPTDSKAPSVEEIMIPSVSELFDAGVEFRPTEGGLTTIRFDNKARKFYLPVVHLDSHTEVILRNLVAYEALALAEPLVLARYTELMNGIIDTPEDVKLLREKKIIVNHLKSDKEVADLWNGMSQKISLTKVPHIDKAIADANTYYSNTPRVKFYKLMKKYVYSSWRILIVLATILLLGLMALQSFCSVYSCPRLFNIDASIN